MLPTIKKHGSYERQEATANDNNKSIKSEQYTQTALVFLAALVCYTTIDLPLTIVIHRHITSTDIYYINTSARWLSLIGETHYSLIPAAICFLLYRKHKPLLANRCKFILTIISTTGGLAYLIKVFLGRYRPGMYFSKGLYGFSNHWINFTPKYLSFPSGHAVTVFSLAFCLSNFYPKYQRYFYCLAVIIACCRVIITFHYPSDVIIGAWFGMWMSQHITKRFFKGIQPC